jgi:membrane protease YdiL (CAAX protease family)
MFLPSLSIIAGITACAFALFHHLNRKYGKQSGSVAWQKEHLGFLALVGILNNFIIAPFFEELLFRAPLLLLFPSLAGKAWLGILFSAVAFSLIHWPKSKEKFAVIIYRANEKNPSDSDDFSVNIEKTADKHRGKIRFFCILQCILAFVAGILYGYLAISFQSLWPSIGAHIVWNLVVPFVLGISIQVILGVLAAIFSGDKAE